MVDVLAIPPINTGEYAFFFDVDGTLAELQPHPDQVSLPPNLIQVFQHIGASHDGALALISGRALSDLDRLTQPLSLAMAGIHGAQRRDIHGTVTRITLSDVCREALRDGLQPQVAALAGVRLEDKGDAFALHYRDNPAQRPAVEALAQRCAGDDDTLSILFGKCVVEIKPRAANKGAAIESFMAQPPFSGRIPVFAGDDVTDEAGFEAVNRLNGISIKVGSGRTQARYRLADVPAVWRWLTASFPVNPPQRNGL